MGHRQTPEEWLDKNPEKVKFVRKRLEKKIGPININRFQVFGRQAESEDERAAVIILQVLNQQIANQMRTSPAHAQIYFDKLRRAWDRAKYAKKHETVLHSFYLDKNTDIAFKKALATPKRTKSELIGYLLAKESKEASSPVNIKKLYQQIEKLSQQKDNAEQRTAIVIQKMNDWFVDLLVKSHEYEIVKKELGTEVDKIVEQHSSEIERYKKECIPLPLLEGTLIKRRKAKHKPTLLE